MEQVFYIDVLLEGLIDSADAIFEVECLGPRLMESSADSFRLLDIVQLRDCRSDLAVGDEFVVTRAEAVAAKVAGQVGESGGEPCPVVVSRYSTAEPRVGQRLLVFLKFVSDAFQFAAVGGFVPFERRCEIEASLAR